MSAAVHIVLDETAMAAAGQGYAAQPTPERPDGAVVATAAARRWAGSQVRVLDLTP